VINTVPVVYKRTFSPHQYTLWNFSAGSHNQNMADANANTSNIWHSVPFTEEMLKQSPVAKTYKHFSNSPQFFHSSMMPQQILDNWLADNELQHVDNNLSKYTTSNQIKCHFITFIV
jgi:hypothetical protein